MIRVKKLAFELIADNSHEGKTWFAEGVQGDCYTIRGILPTVYRWCSHYGKTTSASVENYEQAVAECQAHYESMVLSQIEVEPLVFTTISGGNEQRHAEPLPGHVFTIRYWNANWVDHILPSTWLWHYQPPDGIVYTNTKADTYEDAVAKCNARWRHVVLSHGASDEQGAKLC
jgi:hypothetical protein